MTKEDKIKLISDIRKKLEPSGWNRYLWQFWAGGEFSRIIDYLVKESEEGKRWVPGANNMFRFMEECPVDKVKIVLLIDTVFNTRDNNSGIPYSVPKTAGIKAIQKEMQEYIPGQQKTKKKYINDLSLWTQQGVLMIPTAPTAMIERWGHHKIWSPMISYIINRFNKDKPGIPWVFIGTEEAHEYSDMVQAENKYHMYTYKKDEWKKMWKWVDEQTNKEITWLK